MAKARHGLGDDDLPEYPPGCKFTVRESSFEALGIEDPKPGATIEFAAMARVTSTSLEIDGCRIELEIDMLKLGEGEFAELDEGAKPCICLDENDHERLDLDEHTAQKGHLLHLMGEAQVVKVDDNAYMGGSVTLQIMRATVEDEDEEDDDDG